MRSIITVLIMSAMFATTAQAHPGSEILTTGSGNARSSMTEGVSYEEIGSVHLFKGNTAKSEEGLLGGEPTKRMKIKTTPQAYRTFRGLRTQGFYSGIPYPSRRYTKGFYSTGR